MRCLRASLRVRKLTQRRLCATAALLPRVPLPLDAIVKWQRKATREGSGSGFSLRTEHGLTLITNAHVVADATYVSVRKSRSATTYRANVAALSHECDLAVLTVRDEAFWKGNRDEGPIVGLPLGPLPHLQDHVNVIGFPTGGDGVSVTRGVVSRIEPIQYAHGSIHLLGVQIDASINPGNSGGPALIDNGESHPHVAGVAFQSLVGADNIGYIIPPPVISHFLTQYHMHKKYSGFPQMGLQYQTLENESQRRYLNLDDATSGVVITRIAPVSPAYNVLKPGDVIVEIDGSKIANNGTVHFRDGERLFLNYLLVQKFVGDLCNLAILRNGERIETSFPLISSTDLSLVPVKPTTRPSYLVYGGLVFTKLTLPYLQEFSHQSEDGHDSWYDAAPRSLVHKATTELKKDLDQELVVLSHILPDDINYGYGHISNMELQKFNGVKVKNLKHLTQLLKEQTEKVILASAIVLDAALVKSKNKEILEHYAIPTSKSADLR